MNTTTKKIIDQLKEQNELYKDYILKHSGQPALDRLNLELAIQRTNYVLEARDKKEFEQRRGKIDE